MSWKPFWIFAMTLTLFLSGCVLPAGGHFYSPSSPSGTPKRAYCRGTIGPKNTMEFSLTNATLSISANGVGDDRTHINILIYGTGFSQVEYDAQAVSIFNIDDGTYLQQTDVKEYNDPRSSSHSFYINAAPKQFEVRMPVVTTEGAKYEGLKVTFTYGFGMWPEVPNC